MKKPNKPFEFSKEARQDLFAVLHRRKFKREDIETFITGAQCDVYEWQFLWPPLSAAEMKEGRDRIRNIEKAVNSLIYNMSNLPFGWRQPIWTELEWLATPGGSPEKIAVTLQQANSFLRGFYGAINDQLDAGFFAGGRDNAGKRHLVKHLAQRFKEAFNKRPSAAPTGPFMDVIAIVGETVSTPIGKDAVGAILKELRGSA